MSHMGFKYGGAWDTMIDKSFGQKGHNVPVSSADGAATATITVKDVREWRDSGTKLSFQDWLARRGKRDKAKEVVKTILEGGLQWWKKRIPKADEQYDDSADIPPPEEAKTILGMPKPLAIGIFVLVGLAGIYGIVRLVTMGAKKGAPLEVIKK